MNIPQKAAEKQENKEEFIDLCEIIKKITGMDVRVAGSLNTGTITLSYNNRVSLETLYEIFTK